MFGPLIVIYLFLAGAGCGTFVAAVYLSQRARSSAALRRSLGRVDAEMEDSYLGIEK